MSRDDVDEEPGEGEGDELDDLADLLEGFATRWEQAFRRFRETEEARAQHIAQEADKLADITAQAYSKSVDSEAAVGDVRAHHNSRVVGQIIERQREQQFQEVVAQSHQDRTSIAVQALRESDDIMKQIQEEAERKKQERAARLQEEKRKRDAALAERQKARQRAAREEAAGAGASAGAAAGGAGGPRQAAPPPRFTRTPGQGGPAAGAAAAPAAPAAARKTPQEYRTFPAFEAAWAEFERLLHPGNLPPGGLGVASIPWPSALPTVCGIVAADSPKDRKLKLRAAVLRWHPDKWGPVLEHIRTEERPQVVERVEAVTRRILDERRKFS